MSVRQYLLTTSFATIFEEVRIVRITTSLDFGGQEKKYISFSNVSSKLRYNYVFAAIGKGGYAERNLREKGFEVKIFDRSPSVTNLSNILILCRWLRELKPDIVHTAAGEANFHGVLAARLAGVKVVIAEEIGFPSHSIKARLVFSAIYRWVDKVVCVSQAVLDFLVKIKEIPLEMGQVIYNPVTPPRKVARDSQQHFTIVTIGRLEKVKNQSLLMEALEGLQDKNVRLIIVGNGSERLNLEKEIERLGLQERVSITGFVSDPERYLAKADLFVLPSLSEGFGIAAVEAMHLGIPCLCSEVGGIPEFIEDGINGWLFNPENKSDFMAKLESIRNMDTGDRIAVGLRGRDSIGDRFSEERYIETLERFYQSLVRGD